MIRKTMMALAVAAALTVGCGPKATPVTPQPLGAEEQAQIAKLLEGRWQSTHAKVGDGEKKPTSDVQIVFNPNGTYKHYLPMPFGGKASFDYKFTLEGRNMVTSSPHGTYRVDSVSPTELALFNYDATTIWYFTRQ